jgi:predicted metalloprotease
MRHDEGYESGDVEDRRSDAPARRGGGLGGVGLLVNLVSTFGWKGGLVLFLLFGGVSWFLGLGRHDRGTAPPQQAQHDPTRAFVGQVLDDVQGTWAERLPGYRRAHVVLYAEATTTGCGVGEAAVGPFYCPRDERVYLDATFFRLLKDRLGAPGDFAQAYVIAHELGHHVQHLRGTTEDVERAAQGQRTGEHGLSVKLELQADCYAGVWAASAQRRGILDPGDIDEAMRAAAAVGDDRLQRQATGTIQPEKWTHGSSAARKEWFTRGLERGDPAACDTFR